MFSLPKLHLIHKQTTIIFQVSTKMHKRIEKSHKHSKASWGTNWWYQQIQRILSQVWVRSSTSQRSLPYSGFDKLHHVNHTELNITSFGSSPPSHRPLRRRESAQERITPQGVPGVVPTLVSIYSSKGSRRKRRHRRVREEQNNRVRAYRLYILCILKGNCWSKTQRNSTV